MDPDETLEGYQKLPYHVVFDEKFDLRKKLGWWLVVITRLDLRMNPIQEWLV